MKKLLVILLGFTLVGCGGNGMDSALENLGEMASYEESDYEKLDEAFEKEGYSIDESLGGIAFKYSGSEAETIFEVDWTSSDETVGQKIFMFNTEIYSLFGATIIEIDDGYANIAVEAYAASDYEEEAGCIVSFSTHDAEGVVVDAFDFDCSENEVKELGEEYNSNITVYEEYKKEIDSFISESAEEISNLLG